MNAARTAFSTADTRASPSSRMTTSLRARVACWVSLQQSGRASVARCLPRAAPTAWWSPCPQSVGWLPATRERSGPRGSHTALILHAGARNAESRSQTPSRERGLWRKETAAKARQPAHLVSEAAPTRILLRMEMLLARGARVSDQPDRRRRSRGRSQPAWRFPSTMRLSARSHRSRAMSGAATAPARGRGPGVQVQASRQADDKLSDQPIG